jgi:hypothetical protein
VANKEIVRDRNVNANSARNKAVVAANKVAANKVAANKAAVNKVVANRADDKPGC